MYTAFRENNETLPGDEESLKKPSIKIYLQPMAASDIAADKQLPKLTCPQLIVQKNMNIEAMKKYLIKKIGDQIERVEDVKIIFKGQEMRNDLSLMDIAKIYQFTADRIVFFYSKA
jgi:hypothetical protein